VNLCAIHMCSQAYDGQMAQAVEAVTTDKVPVAEGSNTYSIYPGPVEDLRKALFDLLAVHLRKRLSLRNAWKPLMSLGMNTVSRPTMLAIQMLCRSILATGSGLQIVALRCLAAPPYDCDHPDHIHLARIFEFSACGRRQFVRASTRSTENRD
jgi:hypothetical protein